MLENKASEAESRAITAEAGMTKILMSCTTNLDRMNELRQTSTPRGGNDNQTPRKIISSPRKLTSGPEFQEKLSPRNSAFGVGESTTSSSTKNLSSPRNFVSRVGSKEKSSPRKSARKLNIPPLKLPPNNFGALENPADETSPLLQMKFSDFADSEMDITDETSWST